MKIRIIAIKVKIKNEIRNTPNRKEDDEKPFLKKLTKLIPKKKTSKRRKTKSKNLNNKNVILPILNIDFKTIVIIYKIY